MPHFPMSLQGNQVFREQEDKVICTRLQNGKFSFKSPHTNSLPRSTVMLPASVVWNS